MIDWKPKEFIHFRDVHYSRRTRPEVDPAGNQSAIRNQSPTANLIRVPCVLLLDITSKENFALMIIVIILVSHQEQMEKNPCCFGETPPAFHFLIGGQTDHFGGLHPDLITVFAGFIHVLVAHHFFAYCFLFFLWGRGGRLGRLRRARHAQSAAMLRVHA